MISNMAQAELRIDLQTSTLTVSADYLELSITHALDSTTIRQRDSTRQLSQDGVSQAMRMHVLYAS
jgi:hypothetical protein